MGKAGVDFFFEKKKNGRPFSGTGKGESRLRNVRGSGWGWQKEYDPKSRVVGGRRR